VFAHVVILIREVVRKVFENRKRFIKVINIKFVDFTLVIVSAARFKEPAVMERRECHPQNMNNKRRTGLAAFTLAVVTFGPLTFGQGSSLQEQPDHESRKGTSSTAPDKDDDLTSMWRHSLTSRYWISGQANFIFQAHPDFFAKYSGPNSLRAEGEHATSRVFTLYTGIQLFKDTEFFFDVESAGGRGISNALGLAGFTNLDVVRNPTLGSTPYIARVMIHQVIPLTTERVEAERTPLSLATELPRKRLEFRLGKMSTADFFDVNSVGGDSRLQFTNWTVDNTGAYDYAADTRGYTYGAIIEYQQPQFGIRFGEMLMPTVANGIDLDWALSRSHSENIEAEFRPELLRGRGTAIRLLSYFNSANMGDYREAVNAFLSGQDAKPDITAHRHPGTLKYGFAANMEQEFTSSLRGFVRTGWNEGHHESFAYTEVNSTVAFGVSLRGVRWKRELDRFGSAFVVNGISKDHQQYLRLGGLGFLLGDGNLRYGHELIWENYYTAHIWRGVSISALLQYVVNPGYNQDRGPVLVPGLRIHLEF